MKIWQNPLVQNGIFKVWFRSNCVFSTTE